MSFRDMELVSTPSVDGTSLEETTPTPTTIMKASKPDALFGIRHLQTTLMFLGLLIVYGQRAILSIAIVAMVDKEGANPDYPEYAWDEATKGYILSAFSWGYVVTQIPGGLLAQRHGSKLLAIGMCGASLFTILIPGAAAWGGWRLVCAFLVIQGLAQGLLIPALLSLLAKWSPKEDLGLLLSFVYAGAPLGTTIAMPVSGLLATSAAGWPSTFYVFGGVGLSFSLLYIALGSNSPAEDRRISVQERAYIEDSLRTSGTCSQSTSIPWRALLTSLPMWAMVVASCGDSLGFWTLLDETPTFMKSVLGFKLESNGFMSALPYLISIPLAFFFGWMSDYMTNNKILLKTTSRKLFTAIGFLSPATSMVALTYSRAQTLSVVLLITAAGFNSACNVGYAISNIDLAPNFAGILMGISNCLSNVMGIVAPIIVGAVVTDETSADQWRIVFFISSAVYVIAGIIYMLFGSADIQWWNNHVVRPPVKTFTNAREKYIANA